MAVLLLHVSGLAAGAALGAGGLEAAQWPFAVGALLLGLGGAILGTRLALDHLTRDLRALVSRAGGAAPAGSEPDDLGALTGSVRRLTHELAETLGALRTERDHTRRVLEGLEEGVVLLDADGQVRTANQAAADLLGLGPADLGQSLPGRSRTPALADLLARAHAGEDATAEVALHHPGGERRLLSAHARPLGPVGALVVLRDITEIRRLETMRRDFVANVSHELRTPVSIIRSSAEALADGALEDPAWAPQLLDAVTRNTLRLGRLINDLLRISRIEEGHLSLSTEPVELLPLAQEVVRILEPRRAARGQRFAVTVPDGLEVQADEGALEQILVNLLDNALLYTPARTTITVRAETAGGRVRLEVADDGPGIAAHHHARVFERFYRVDAGRARDDGGSGLGLAIVKHLAEAMGGGVSLHNHPPRGAVFRVELPAAGPEAPAAAAAPGSPPG